LLPWFTGAPEAKVKSQSGIGADAAVVGAAVVGAAVEAVVVGAAVVGAAVVGDAVVGVEPDNC
jgi:hypothetical protein